MLDGWYLLQRTVPNEEEKVEFCYRNTFPSGSVPTLIERNYTFTEVAVVPKQELKKGLAELKREEFETCCGMLENHSAFRMLESLANL